MLGLDPLTLTLCLVVCLVAGFVKGAVGFAMPMIMMSALSSFLAPTMALALLILPTLVTNVAQAFCQGPAEAFASARRFRLHIAAVVVALALSAQVVTEIPKAPMSFVLGLPILAFAIWQLAGRPLAIRIEHRAAAEIALGVIGGLYGGISGIWGPPLLVLLLSLHTEKQEMMRVQGVVFLIGSLALLAAHLSSGVLDARTLPLSALMVAPALVGNLIGVAVHDRLDQARFRRWTLVLLALAGANLVRLAFA